MKSALADVATSPEKQRSASPRSSCPTRPVQVEFALPFAPPFAPLRSTPHSPSGEGTAITL